MKPKLFKYPYYLLVVAMCLGLTARAQKLPNVQQGGMLASANVKVDGKADEWNNAFQAYNKSTSIFYSLVNNNDNLYLVIQAKDKTAIGKILGGGLTLSISNKAGALISITTPATTAPIRSNIAKATGSPDPISDSLLTQLNIGLQNSFKEIKLSGIAAIPDSAISVYNDYGIKVSGRVNTDKAYSCELAIPLKYLNTLINGGSFNYNITLNGIRFGASGMRIDGQAVDQASPAVAAIMMNIKLDGSPMMELASSTDFSGSYTLIKK